MNLQQARFNGTPLTCNADMGSAHIREYCEVDEAGKSLMRAAMQQLGMSARSFHRVLTRACATGAGKLARTIADLEGAERIQVAHLAEALQCGACRKQTHSRAEVAVVKETMQPKSVSLWLKPVTDKRSGVRDRGGQM